MNFYKARVHVYGFHWKAPRNASKELKMNIFKDYEEFRDAASKARTAKFILIIRKVDSEIPQDLPSNVQVVWSSTAKHQMKMDLTEIEVYNRVKLVNTLNDKKEQLDD